MQWMNTLTAWLIMLLFCLQAHAQERNFDRKISLSGLIQELYNTDSSTFLAENYLVTETDSCQQFVRQLSQQNQCIEAAVTLRRCVFYRQKANVFGLHKVDLKINNLRFEQPFVIQYCKGLESFQLYNTQFLKGFRVIGGDINYFYSNETQFDILMKLQAQKVYMVDSKIQLKDHWNQRIKRVIPTSFELSGLKSSCHIIGFSIVSNSANNYVVLGGDFNVLNLDSVYSNADIILRNCKIKDKIEVKKSRLSLLGLNGVSQFPDDNNLFIEWSNMTKGLALVREDMIALQKGQDPVLATKYVYTGKTTAEQASKYEYAQLIALYNKMYHLYRHRGDFRAANACYVQMKDVQTCHLQYVYSQSPSLNNWLYWKLNIFLSFFCDYGTNPVRAVICSLWAILGFALLYFFFYSSWDKINRSFLVQQHHKLLIYFQTKQSLKDFYTREIVQELVQYQDYKRTLKNSKQLPFYVRSVGPLLYRAGVFKFKWMRWWFHKIDILNTQWDALSRRQRWRVGSKALLAIGLYLTYLLCIKAANAIFLSINAFSTLGFGDIPVKGASRYLAIFEGFIGWFLLSIFSVSLVSQILQN